MTFDNWQNRRVTVGVRTFVGIAVSVAVACAQPSTASLEVVSVRKNLEPAPVVSMNVSGTRVTIHAFPLLGLVINAYKVEPNQVQGGPPWLISDRFDITAIASGEGKLSPVQVQELLRSILEQRFALKVHRDKKKASAFKLTVEKAGKMTPSKPDAPKAVDLGGRKGTVQLEVKNGTMAELANQLGNANLGKPVVDDTHLEGGFDYKLRWSTIDAAVEGPEPALPSIFVALQEQLGLRLRPGETDIDVVVIDHVQRPTANE